MGTPNQKRLAELGQLPNYMKKDILIEVEDLRGQVKKLKKENNELLDKISILESDKNVDEVKTEKVIISLKENPAIKDVLEKEGVDVTEDEIEIDIKEEKPIKRPEIMKELKEKGIKFKPSMNNSELLELLK